MKKKNCIISTIVILSVLVIFAITASFIHRSRFSLTIDGYEIGKEELLNAANQKKYEVASYFAGKGSNVDAGFWERETEGEIPYEKLAEAAIEDLKYFHAVYGLAEEKGYVEDGSYEAFQQRFKEENQFRKERIENGEVIYGLSEYTLELYREYEMDSIQKSYCAELDNEGMEVTDADRKVYFEEHSSSYQREDDRALDYIKIPYTEEEMDEEQVKEFKNCLTSIYKNMDGEHSLAELAGAEEMVAPYLEHADVTAGELRSYSRSISDILEYAWELEKGDSTAVLDEEGALYLIECTGRNENNPVSIEEVRDNINKILREERYDRIIEKRAEEATVEGDMERIFFFVKKHINE